MTLFEDEQKFNSHSLIKSATELYNSGIITINQLKTIKTKVELKFGVECGTRGIEFILFWDAYGKKVGDKNEVEKLWNLLSPTIQNKILSVLPEWVKQFASKQFQPNAETFINAKRWNDEIIPQDKLLKPVFDQHGNGKIQGAQSILQNYQDL